MHLEKFFKNETGKVIMSVLLGLGLATLFRHACKGDDCLIRHAAPIEEIDGQVYRFDKKCYKFNKNPVNCDKNKKIISFA
jgi:hypothetical protein